MSEQTPWAFHVKVNVNRLRPSSRARPPRRCPRPAPRAPPSSGQGGDLASLDLLWTGGGLETLCISLRDERKSGLGHSSSSSSNSSFSFSSSSSSIVTCCPSETGLCAPAHALSSRCAGRRDARPSLWIRHTLKSQKYAHTTQFTHPLHDQPLLQQRSPSFFVVWCPPWLWSGSPLIYHIHAIHNITLIFIATQMTKMMLQMKLHVPLNPCIILLTSL